MGVGEFPRCGATPGDAKQKEEWEKKHDLEGAHLWDYPMLPTKLTEASCAKCHKQQASYRRLTTWTSATPTYERPAATRATRPRVLTTSKKRVRSSRNRLQAEGRLGEEPGFAIRCAVKQTTWMAAHCTTRNTSSKKTRSANEVEIWARRGVSLHERPKARVRP